MAGEPANSSLDLSHLTEAEQSKILQVLQRDLDLRLLDEGRVRILQETETDQRRLRSLSGAWFTEERNKRHHTWSGSALVHATLRCKRTKNRGLLICSPAGARIVPLTGFCGCCYSNGSASGKAVRW
ncbi:unnamed protein product [Tetraodon nigroviridis]|uniref:(spotted green pufferfish) hypothetical protein n=1 Tax=Tetraodon nigroviridis TaxID=99883 RepID=Q4RNK6_TETNG|nr:unnamed protein product [Tetraodon nigroviridis]